MRKAMAVLRSLFLLFIVVFTLRALPLFGQMPRTFDEQYARCSSTLEQIQRAAWYAIGWIALETAVGWFLALRRPKAPPEPKPKPEVPMVPGL